MSSVLDERATLRSIVGRYDGSHLIGNHIINLPAYGDDADRVTDAEVAACGVPGVRVVYEPLGNTLREEFDILQYRIDVAINRALNNEQVKIKKSFAAYRMSFGKRMSKLSRDISAIATQ